MTDKITGYRALTQVETDLINEVKALAIKCGAVCEALSDEHGISQRWLAIGTTDLQKGFMAVIRSIAKPTTF